MAALGLVPRPFGLALAGRVGFDEHRTTGKRLVELVERHPHRFGNAGCVNQAIARADFEQHRGPIIGELEHCRKALHRPRLQAANQGLATHPDLVQRGFDLVKRKRAAVGQCQPRPQEDRGRRPVGPAREES